MHVFSRIHTSTILLCLIIIIASFLRLYHLDTNPPSPYWEETALGVDAYSISKTGSDIHGNRLPILAFPSFGDYKPAGYFYVLVPFIKLFGLNLLAVRLPSALAGILSVFLLYLIGSHLLNKKIGIIAAALMSVSPWAIQFSRGGWEVNLALTFILLGTWSLLLARRRPLILLLSVLFFCLSMYTYHAARLFAPLLGGLGGLIILIEYIKRPTRIKILSLALSFFLSIALIAPFIVNLKSSTVSSRFDQTSIFSDPEPVLLSNKLIADNANTRLARLVYHRFWFYGANVARQYVSFFTPDFLFVRGDGNLRHTTVAFGLFYYLDALMLIAAFFYAIKKQKYKILLLIVPILFAAIAPSLVTPAPHALRFLLALPSFILLIAFGISSLPRRLNLPLVILYFFFVLSYLRYYHSIYPVKAASDWQYGYAQVLTSLATHKQPGEAVYMTRQQGRPSMYYLFYTPFDPSTLQKLEPTLPKDQLELLAVGDYHFVDALPSSGGLYATSPNNVTSNITILDTITRPDGTAVWIVWRR